MILLIVILIILHAFLAQIVDGDSGEIFIFIIFFFRVFCHDQFENRNSQNAFK